MTQAQLDRAVAQTTGESLATIRSRGFSLVEPGPISDLDPCDSPHVVDWDEVDRQRLGLMPGRFGRSLAFSA
jgi:hypothetical protein